MRRSHPAPGGAKGLILVLDLYEAPVTCSNRLMIQRLVGNLLSNAVR